MSGAAQLLVLGMGTLGTIYQAQTQSASAKYNAALAEQQAKIERAKADAEISIHDDRTRKLLSRQRAGYGAAGVSSEGSPLAVMADTAAEAERDAVFIRFGHRAKEASYLADARYNRWMAPRYTTSGFLRAGSTLLTGVDRIGSDYTSYTNRGGSGSSFWFSFH